MDKWIFLLIIRLRVIILCITVVDDKLNARYTTYNCIKGISAENPSQSSREILETILPTSFFLFSIYEFAIKEKHTAGFAYVLFLLCSSFVYICIAQENKCGKLFEILFQIFFCLQGVFK